MRQRTRPSRARARAASARSSAPRGCASRLSRRAPRDRAPLAPCHGAANDAVIELATRRTLAEAVAGLAIQLRFRPDETPDVRIAGIPAAGTAADEAWSLPQADVARGAAEDVALAGGLRGGGCFCGPAVGGAHESAQLSVGELPISFLAGPSTVRRLTPSACSLAHAGLVTAEAEGLCISHRAARGSFVRPGRLFPTYSLAKSPPLAALWHQNPNLIMLC